MALPASADVVIIGAGAAGLMCAATAGQRGRQVLVLDHANKVGKKILMSGGGRCNFTNLFTQPDNFLSANPHFCKSALARFTQWDFIALVQKHGIAYHEKKLGQLFCDHKAQAIVDMLLDECAQAGAEIRTQCSIQRVSPLPVAAAPARYRVHTSQGQVECQSLVIATGGLSIPTMGATGLGYDLAQQFGLPLRPRRAGLVPFTLTPAELQALAPCVGNAVEARVSCNGQRFVENILFTHRGLSGPAILQISSYWQPGERVHIDLFPHLDLFDYLQGQQQQRPKALLTTVLGELLTRNIAQCLCGLWCDNLPLNQYSTKALRALVDAFQQWQLLPAGTEGYRTAEVTLGGVDTACLSSKTLAVNSQPGLHFIGEVVDVTGHLGGFNFQWAWASGVAAGEAV